MELFNVKSVEYTESVTGLYKFLVTLPNVTLINGTKSVNVPTENLITNNLYTFTRPK